MKYEIVVKIDERFYRQDSDEFVFGDINKIKNDLGWVPKTSFKELIRMMVDSDLKKVAREIIISKI